MYKTLCPRGVLAAAAAAALCSAFLLAAVYASTIYALRSNHFEANKNG